MKTHLKKGFTLIELLIVVVIIGILAAIAIPKFATTKEKAYLAAMKTDLRNLVTAEEGYASNNAGAYTSTQSAIPYTPSTGVTVTVSTSGNGWSATATHSAASGKTCGIYVNLSSAPGGSNPASVEGEPKCD